MISVEYLFPFNTKDSICKDIESFNSLLQSNSDLSIKQKKITYKNSEYKYDVNVSLVPDEECSVFHVTFSHNRTTDKFRKMLKAVRTTVGPHLRNNIQLIWDDVSFEWSKNLYPCIFTVENMMRKLISKFMLINLGVGWHESAVPKNVKESIKTKEDKTHLGILYEADFIQLANFLFTKYSIKDINNLPEVLTAIHEGELTAEDKAEIGQYIPKNNWDRYFSNIVDSTSDELKKKWKQLYDIRIKVAHNKSMLLEDYENGNELCTFLKEILEKAIENLNAIKIPEEEKDSISLNTAANIWEPARTFTKDYKLFNEGLLKTIQKNESFFPMLAENYAATANKYLELYPSIPDDFKISMENITDAKNALFNVGSISALDNIASASGSLFAEASRNLILGYEGIKPAEEILKFIEVKDEKSKKEE